MIGSSRSLSSEREEEVEVKKILLQYPKLPANRYILYCPAFFRIKVERMKGLHMKKLCA